MFLSSPALSIINVGAEIGAFFATVMSDSLRSLLLFTPSKSLNNILVLFSKTLSSPPCVVFVSFLNFEIFIFLGSLRLSVQKSMPSIIFMPVTKLFFEKFNILFIVYEKFTLALPNSPPS